LNKMPQFQVIAVAINGEIAVQKVAELQPDVVLMDVELPAMSGIEATRQIIQKHPHVKILMMSGHADKEVILSCFLAGASGYFLKSTPGERLRTALETIVNGSRWIDPAIDASIAGEIKLSESHVTPSKEISINELVGSGVAAFKNCNFEDAVKYLLGAIDQDPRNWRARLYLGMSYFKTDSLFLAITQFRFLQDNCTDTEIREKAVSALASMNSQVQGQVKLPQMSCEIKKPKTTPELDNEDEVEVVSTTNAYYNNAQKITPKKKKSRKDDPDDINWQG
ncbi:MAG TPA: response regulator, partial [Nitrososphaera sp.]|nr:response regulator [Nitrososphaera sp.]